MSRSSYEPRAEYIGTGALAEYTFDFKIKSLSELIVAVYDSSYVEQFRVRGDDTTDLDSVDFDAEVGGGTVYLPAALTTGYTIVILLANDEPTQDSEFKNKTDFTLKRFEDALDALSGQIQRLAYLAARSIKLWDGFPDSDSFNPELGIYSTDQGVQATAGKVLTINSTGDGLDLLDTASLSGPSGADGADGADGVGVPAGGSTGQVLTKIDGTDYNTQWSTVSSGGGALRSGEESISNAVSSHTIAFSSSTSDTTYIPTFSISNVTDSSPIFLQGIITGKTTSGFTVTFNTATDSANYVMEYTANAPV